MQSPEGKCRRKGYTELHGICGSFSIPIGVFRQKTKCTSPRQFYGERNECNGSLMVRHGDYWI